MITAHLPASYCLVRGIGLEGRHVLGVALLAAILPDTDLLLHYFVDDRQFHHHRYWVHIPVFWAVVACFAMPIAYWLKQALAR